MERSASPGSLRLSGLNFRCEETGDGADGHTRDDPAGERSVSPVIGIVLMLAVTVSLAMLVVPLVFSVAGDSTDPAPSASFSYSYTEADPASTQDDFGQTGGSADGILRITMETGDNIDASQLEVSAMASGGNLVDDTPASVFDVGDNLSPGDSIEVWATRGERVEIIWSESGGGETDILAEFSVAPLTSTAPPGAPTPEYDCDYLDDPNNYDTSTNVLEIDGDVVQCDLSEDSTDVDNLTLTNGGALIGEAMTDAEVNVHDESLIWGDVDTGVVVLRSNSTVNGNVKASSDFDAKESEVDGRVRTGSATLDPGTKIRLRLKADNPVTLDDARVGGDIIGGDNVTLNGGSVVEQDVEIDPTTSSLNCNDGNTSTINGQGCEAYAAADFAVAIDDTNEPIEDGEDFNASVEVTNEGYDSGSKTVELLIDGTVEDSSSITLAGGNNQTELLQWTSAPKGNYTVKVQSPDDALTRSLRVYATGEAPRSFEFLNVTTTNSSDDITSAEFDWETDRKANITFEATNGTVQDTESVTLESSNTTMVDGFTEIGLPAYIRADIDNGECYEYKISSGEEGQEYDLLEQGWNC